MSHRERLQTQLHRLNPRLPLPSDEAISHSERLHQHLSAQLANQPMPFSAFMADALYAPGLGYYSAGATKLGASGDFVTAPEISPLFARCLARQCAEVLQAIGGGELLEFGAGRGIMARDLLLELQALDALPSRYLIIEVSADLRQRQQETLQQLPADIAGRVVWLEHLPATFSGVILANEVLDAMPATVWCRRDGELLECAVTRTEQGEFAWTELPADKSLQRWFASLPAALVEQWPALYRSEMHPLQAGWLHSLGRILQRGAVLLIDYGFPRHEFYHPDRSAGTLMCHYRHHAHPDPLVLVGLQDLTAHVDFTAVAEQALAAGLDVLGYCHQAGFLQSLGVLDMAMQIRDETEQIVAAQALKKLLMPHEMGELFKVIALGKGLDDCLTQPLTGFALYDMRERL
ncbi:class I SAM-dependent methyltransferase [Permianibacter sp. IMCC34836]|nr:class I SAM-dependent methyltransferase [Permianibacter fluminis]